MPVQNDLLNAVRKDDPFDAMNVAGLGTKVWIGRKSDLKDGKLENAVCFDLSKPQSGLYKSDAVNESSVKPTDKTNPFRGSYPVKIVFDETEVNIHCACVLTKAVLPYRSALPFFVKKDVHIWDDDYIHKKPWSYYQFPAVKVYIIGVGYRSYHYLLTVNDKVIAYLSGRRYSILSGAGNVDIGGIV